MTGGDGRREELRIAAVAGQLRALGAQEGGVLLVHTSFRAVRPIEGGPPGLVEALRAAVGPAGTLVMPSWTGSDEEPFEPAATPAAPDLGVVAETFRRLPGVARSEHAFAFAALGPRAAEIVAGALPLPPHAPESPAGRVHALRHGSAAGWALAAAVPALAWSRVYLGRHTPGEVAAGAAIGVAVGALAALA